MRSVVGRVHVQLATARLTADRTVAVIDAKILTDDVITLLAVKAKYCVRRYLPDNVVFY